MTSWDLRGQKLWEGAVHLSGQSVSQTILEFHPIIRLPVNPGKKHDYKYNYVLLQQIKVIKYGNRDYIKVLGFDIKFYHFALILSSSIIYRSSIYKHYNIIRVAYIQWYIKMYEIWIILQFIITQLVKSRIAYISQCIVFKKLLSEKRTL